MGFRYGKKHFVKTVTSYSFIKNDIMFVYLLCIYRKLIILSLFKIDRLNFTMCVLTILTCSLKAYVIRSHNLISMNILFTIKEKTENKRIKKTFLKTQASLNPISMSIFFTIKYDSFPL